MRHIVCFLILLTTLPLGKVFGKDEYKSPPLLAGNKQWNVLEERSEEGRWTYIYKLDGDTIINGRKYWILYHTVDKQAKKWRRQGYLYEDTAQKKVWFHFLQNNHDGLIYNFDVTEGDTVYTMSRFTADFKEKHDSIRHIVKRTDTIRINDGDYRRIIVESTYIGMSGASHYSFENEWIEGIGSKKGLFSIYVMLPGSFNETLLAFYHDGKLVYKSPEYKDVFIWETVGNEPIGDMQIFVSPDGRILHLGNAGFASPCTVVLYSIQGAVVFRQIIAPHTAVVGLPLLPQGVYVANIHSRTREISRKVVVK